MRRPRPNRLLLLPLVFVIALMVKAVHSAVIYHEDDPPADPPPQNLTASTANGATVTYDEAEWGQPGSVDVDFVKNAAGQLVTINIKDSDGNVLASMTQDQAAAFMADSTTTLVTPPPLAKGTMNSTSSGYHFTTPITSVYGAGVTVNGDFTWR